MMQTKSPILSRLAGVFFGAGVSIFFFGAIAKQQLPQNIGLSPAVQLPCAFFSAVLIPFGSFLAFRQLATGADKRRVLLFYHFGGVIFLIAILSLYFFNFYLLGRTLEPILPNDLPSSRDVLVKLINSARNSATAEKRDKAAKYAYRLYGADVTYQSDAAQTIIYQPTADDEAAWRQSQELNRQVTATRNLVTQTLVQIPYLVGLYASTFTIAYIAGGTCVAFRMPRGGGPSNAIQH